MYIKISVLRICLDRDSIASESNTQFKRLIMSGFMKQAVTSVRHWNDTLFSFTTKRDPSFRFKNGHFIMIGLEQEDGRPLMRAYSIASANHEEELEFSVSKCRMGLSPPSFKRSRLVMRF